MCQVAAEHLLFFSIFRVFMERNGAQRLIQVPLIELLIHKVHFLLFFSLPPLMIILILQ